MRSVVVAFGLVVVAMQLAFEALACSPSAWGDSQLVEQVKAVKLGKITSKESIRLIPVLNCKDTDFQNGCAGAPIKNGVEGLELERNGDWVCVAVPGKRPLDILTGWFPAKKWQVIEDLHAPKNWAGVWQNGNAKLLVKNQNNQILINGKGLWVGSYSPHFGEFTVLGTPRDGVVVDDASFEPGFGGCQIALRLVGNFIYAADNSNCGAINVSFSGLYRYRFKLK